jgi:hypothetical protein
VIEHTLEELRRDAARYRYLRTVSPREFSALWETNLRGGHRFDELVDARIKQREEEWSIRKRFGAS